MIKTKLFGFFVAFVSMGASAFASVNPDPSYIQISNSGSKVKLKPHGFDNHIPSDDTRNFQWIFNNYPHADINLERGTYHISELVEGANYQGTISGDGQNETHIVGRGPLVDGQYVFPALDADKQARMYLPGTPWLFWFHPIDGDVNDWESTKLALKVKDLSFRLDGLGALSTLYEQPLYAVWGHILITGHNANYHEQVGNISHVEIDFKNVTFESQFVTYDLYGQTKTHSNVAAGFLLYGGEDWRPDGVMLNHMNEIDHSPINAQIKVKDCVFKNQFQYGFGAEGLFTSNTGLGYSFPTTNSFPNSSLTAKNNIFDNAGNGANIIGGAGYNILLLGISETDIVIKDNEFLNIPSVGIVAISGSTESMPKEITNLEITDNYFQQSATAVAGHSVFLFDLMYPFTGYFGLNIRNNTFTGDAGYNMAFVNIGMGTGSVIRNNTFSGSGQAAIAVGNFQSPYPPYQILPGSNIEASKNDFSQLNATVANVILGPASSTCTIKVSEATDVINNGQNNTVIVK